MSFAIVLPLMLLCTTMSDVGALQTRDQIIKEELANFVGGRVNLTEKELKVNDLVLQKKVIELNEGYKNPSKFWPSVHFFEAKHHVDGSEVFDLIRRLPKGASLHTHVLAAVSNEFVITNLTYLENLYGGYVNGVFKLKFFQHGKQTTEYKPLEHYRQTQDNFDDWLLKKLSLVVDNVEESYPSVTDVWAKFKQTFTTLYDMVCYKPAFQIYITQLLNELYEDNVLYTELKGTFMPLYELDGTTYNTRDFFRIFINTVEDFKKQHPDFLGVKYIHSVYRGVDNEVLSDALEALIELKEEFPNFIAGFDFVGYEEEGKTLYDYRHELLNASRHGMKFFFHAGETNWFGHTDLNLVDAVLLNASRIGHGFALDKHPNLIKLGKEKNIPIELCPISNQVLMLVKDLRNHPAASLMAQDYPVIVGNDDPSLWNASGLSYDWYVTFMGMTPEGVGLGFLKQLAINSLKFSEMNDDERARAYEIWNQKWNIYLDLVLANS
ncbi:adenosine deaminase 2-like [Aethina tumida]|uniref:adenosine deaminase 2-like n=1 Tax=Aethina tumida TaxID=116153 RepID=UPI0021476EB7|nr:adenosine deaminase 2-like [Aethina tumida]